MKNIVKFALLSLAVVASSSVFAGRNELQLQMEEQSKKANAANQSDRSYVASQVLPLDHGPRATTNQWLNQQRRLQSQNPSSAAEGK
jgi:hypothetical protein